MKHDRRIKCLNCEWSGTPWTAGSDRDWSPVEEWLQHDISAHSATGNWEMQYPGKDALGREGWR